MGTDYWKLSHLKPNHFIHGNECDVASAAALKGFRHCHVSWVFRDKVPYLMRCDFYK